MKFLALVLPFALAGSTPALAQQLPATPEISATSAQTAPVFRSGASLVALNVSVLDSSRNFVTGLGPDDFAVYEDGVQQQVRFFDATEVPLDLIILLDTSASMSDKMDVVHAAAVGFLGTLRAGDRGAVVAFSDGVQVVQALTSDRGRLESAIRATTARGATALNNAIYIALKEFGRSARQDGDVRRQAIAVLSDGEDTASLMSFDDVLALARKSGVGIYTIALQSKYAMARTAAAGGRPFFSEAQYSMKTLARETGAESFFPESVAGLKDVYAAITRELSSQYALAYAPSNTRSDGRYRRIVVQLPAHPELKPKARTGYTPETERRASDIGPKGYQYR